MEMKYGKGVWPKGKRGEGKMGVIIQGYDRMVKAGHS